MTLGECTVLASHIYDGILRRDCHFSACPIRNNRRSNGSISAAANDWLRVTPIYSVYFTSKQGSCDRPHGPTNNADDNRRGYAIFPLITGAINNLLRDSLAQGNLVLGHNKTSQLLWRLQKFESEPSCHVPVNMTVHGRHRRRIDGKCNLRPAIGRYRDSIAPGWISRRVPVFSIRII